MENFHQHHGYGHSHGREPLYDHGQDHAGAWRERITPEAKARMLDEAEEAIAKAYTLLKALGEDQPHHGYATTGAAADKMLNKARVLYADVRRWRLRGDHAAAMQTAGSVGR